MSAWFWEIKRGSNKDPLNGDKLVRRDGASVEFFGDIRRGEIKLTYPTGKVSKNFWTSPDTMSYFTDYIDAIWPYKEKK